MGFHPVGRHRSREVEVYRQGSMNLIVNAQPADVPRAVQPVERPVISAFAVRVRDADYAFRGPSPCIEGNFLRSRLRLLRRTFRAGTAQRDPLRLSPRQHVRM